MADYTAARIGNAIVVTMPLSAIVKSIEGDPVYFGADRVEVLDIDALVEEIVASINASNSAESVVLCEADTALEDGTKSLVLHRNAIAA
ncbi:hypothetical protein FIU28_17470 [Tardiphaga sp. vice154]|uniref:hypothetical protein n=1 Tax=Tardiphaga sp. vice154 TaxID=2592814 RepID=UPI001162635E|nr:hypothetical protein [Tardiphaga sp. vice154]QDM22742.1 hypothetical protein FIU28_17470 [Tardiphaga sp. vice154]